MQRAKESLPSPLKCKQFCTKKDKRMLPKETFPQQQRAPRIQKGQQNRKFQEKRKPQKAKGNIESIKNNYISNLTSEKRIKETKKENLK